MHLAEKAAESLPLFVSAAQTCLIYSGSRRFMCTAVSCCAVVLRRLLLRSTLHSWW